MKQITSAENDLFKAIKVLQSAKGRREQSLFLAEGPHLAEEAMSSSLTVRYIVVRETDVERFSGLIAQAEKAEAEALSLSPRLFDALADTGSPQGVLAVVEIRWRDLSEQEPIQSPLAVVLERVQDPGNVGTILRTALAVGAAFAVLTDDCADPWSPKVVRASQGAVLHLPLVRCAGAGEAISALSRDGWLPACGHLQGEDFFSRQSSPRTALVIGNEASGITEETASACAARWKLPMPGKAESLNAAVAAGVMLYDLWREHASD